MFKSALPVCYICLPIVLRPELSLIKIDTESSQLHPYRAWPARVVRATQVVRVHDFVEKVLCIDFTEACDHPLLVITVLLEWCVLPSLCAKRYMTHPRVKTILVFLVGELFWRL